MLHSGHNEIDGVPVEVVRKRIRRINIRVAAEKFVGIFIDNVLNLLPQAFASVSAWKGGPVAGGYGYS